MRGLRVCRAGGERDREGGRRPDLVLLERDLDANLARDGFVSNGMKPERNERRLEEKGGRNGLEPVVEGEVVDGGGLYLEGTEKTGVGDGAVVDHAGDERILGGDIA